MNIEVDFNGMDSNIVEQIDNSAQSFISSMVISSQNVEMERIWQYDTMAAMLYDMNFGI